MSSKLTPDQSTKKAEAYADDISDDDAVDAGYEPEPTYCDASLKNECGIAVDGIALVGTEPAIAVAGGMMTDVSFLQSIW